MADAREPGAPRLTQNQIWERRGLAVLLIFAAMLGGVVWWRGHPPGQKPPPASRHAALGPPGPPRLVVQMGHSAAITALAFSPDSTLLASASHDGVVKVWDAAQGALRQSERAHQEWVTALAFAPDGQTLASAGADKVVRLRDAWTGALPRTVLHTKPVLGVAFSADGKMGLSAVGNQVRWWNVRSGGASPLTSQLAIEEGAPLQSFAVSGGVPLLATCASGMIHLWDARTGKLRHQLVPPNGPSGGEWKLAFASDGQSLAAADANGLVQLWETRRGTVSGTLSPSAFSAPGGSIVALAWSPDGKTLAAAGDDGNVILWDVPGATLRRKLTGHNDGAAALAFAPNGQTLAVGDGQGAVLLWDTATWSLRRTLLGPLQQVVQDATLDGKTLFTGATDGRIRRWNLQMGRLDAVWQAHAAGVNTVGLTPDAKTLVSAGRELSLKLWDARTGRLQRTLTGYGGSIRTMGFPRRGAQILTVSHGQMPTPSGPRDTLDLTVRSIAGGPLRRVLRAPAPEGWFWLQGKNRFTLGTDEGEAKIWEAETGRLLWAAASSAPPLTNLVFAPDEKTFATLNAQGTVKLYQLAARPKRALSVKQAAHGARLVRVLLRRDPFVKDVRFTPDGKQLATADQLCLLTNGTATMELAFSSLPRTAHVRVWDVATGRLVQTLPGDGLNLPFNDYLPSEEKPEKWRILSENPDGTRSLWDARSGRLLVTLAVLPNARGLQPTTEWIAYTPDGYYNASPGATKFIRWRLGDELFPATKFEQEFHRPDLLQKTLQAK